MKDGLGVDAIERIIHALGSVDEGFPAVEFRHDALEGLDTLELKERVHHLIAVLHRHLPADFEEASAFLVNMKSHWDYGDKNDSLRGFAAWPIIDYIGVYGLNHPETSLSLLRHLTSLFSAEFAIRPFVTEHSGITFRHLEQWCRDPDEHVRRLVSEGTRPRLPWGEQLPRFIADPMPLLPLLESLKDDESEYVRRSVANSLNDISKDHPDLVIQTCRKWFDLSASDSSDSDSSDSDPIQSRRLKLIRHATRTLVKRGYPDVFGLLGYTESPKLSLQNLQLERQHIVLGETLNIAAVIKSTASEQQRVVIDYAVHQMKANGKRVGKVFKLKQLTIAPGESVELKKSHPFKKITTRTYYSGQHAIELLINGVGYGQIEFELSVPQTGR